MEYYHIESWQNYSNGLTTGRDTLKKEEGATIPDNTFYNDGYMFAKNDYFRNYKDA